MGELELEQMQEKIDAGILLTQERLKEKVKREDGQLVVMRDGKVTHLKADEIEACVAVVVKKLTKKLNVSVAAYSASAKQKIEEAGGKAEVK